MEKIYLKYKKQFAAYQIIGIAYTLICLDTSSENFIKDLDKYFLDFDKKGSLTELLNFQCIYILMKRPEFNEEALMSFMKNYLNFLNRNQVKQKQIKHLMLETENI